MFRLFFRISMIGILFFGLTTACTEEDTLGGGGVPRPVEEEPLGPSIDLVADVGLVSSSADIPAGTAFTVRVSAQAGEAALKSFAVVENGATMPFNRLQFSDPDIGANPALILKEADKTGIDWEITILAPETEASHAYSFEITDENDKVAVVFLNINTVPMEVLPPSAVVVEEAPYFWGQKACPPGTSFTMLVRAEQGSAPITSITVLEDGIVIDDITRLKANGAEFPANPWIFTDGLEALEAEISIRTSEDGNNHTYQVVIGDGNEESSLLSIDVIAEATGTNLTNSLTGKLLLNQAGPAGTGGIDLFTGEGTGSSDSNAHLRDEGIDLDSEMAANWKRQISAINGAIIRTVDPSEQPEGFSFGAIQFKEEVQSLFDTGRDLITQNDTGRFVTPFVIVGDIFAVQQGDTYFLVEVTNLNVTEIDNNDYYVLSIKY